MSVHLLKMAKNQRENFVSCGIVIDATLCAVEQFEVECKLEMNPTQAPTPRHATLPQRVYYLIINLASYRIT
jgi:hypothetical protein